MPLTQARQALLAFWDWFAHPGAPEHVTIRVLWLSAAVIIASFLIVAF